MRGLIYNSADGTVDGDWDNYGLKDKEDDLKDDVVESDWDDYCDTWWEQFYLRFVTDVPFEHVIMYGFMQVNGKRPFAYKVMLKDYAFSGEYEDVGELEVYYDDIHVTDWDYDGDLVLRGLLSYADIGKLDVDKDVKNDLLTFRAKLAKGFTLSREEVEDMLPKVTVPLSVYLGYSEEGDEEESDIVIVDEIPDEE